MWEFGSFSNFHPHLLKSSGLGGFTAACAHQTATSLSPPLHRPRHWGQENSVLVSYLFQAPSYGWPRPKRPSGELAWCWRKNRLFFFTSTPTGQSVSFHLTLLLSILIISWLQQLFVIITLWRLSTGKGFGSFAKTRRLTLLSQIVQQFACTCKKSVHI